MADDKKPTEKKPGFWSKLGGGILEVVAQLLYSGPR